MKHSLRNYLLLLALMLSSVAALAADLNKIVAHGRVRIGVCEFTPWTFTDKVNHLEGFEIDVGTAVAHDLGVKPEFKVYTLDAVVDALAKGEIDFIAGGLAITPARALRVEFSTPYAKSGATVVANRTLVAKAETVADLNQPGFTIVTVEDSFSAGLAAQLFDIATIKALPDEAAAEKELLEGRAQAFLTSVPSAKVLALRFPAVAATPFAEPLVGSVAGLAVQPGNQSLLNFLNAWIAARTADKWLERTHAYWFDGTDWNRSAKP